MRALAGGLCFAAGTVGIWRVWHLNPGLGMLAAILLTLAAWGASALIWRRWWLSAALTTAVSAALLLHAPRVLLTAPLFGVWGGWLGWWARPRTASGLTVEDGWFGAGLLFLVSTLFSLLLAAGGVGTINQSPGLLIGAYLSTPPIEAAVAVMILVHAKVWPRFLDQHYRVARATPPDRSFLVGQGILIGVGVSLLSAAVVTIQIQGLHWSVRSNNPFVYSPHFTTHNLLGTMGVILAVIVMAPLAEEILFRGILFGALADSWPYPVASGAAAMTFALAHLDFSLIISLFIAGLLFNQLYRRTRSLIPSTVAHATLNGISVVLALLSLHA